MSKHGHILMANVKINHDKCEHVTQNGLIIVLQIVKHLFNMCEKRKKTMVNKGFRNGQQ